MRCGAGRPGWHLKTTAATRLDVRDLQRKGALDHATATVALTWASGANIRVDVEGESATLVYRYKFNDGWRDISQRVSLERTPCHYGGTRPWFRCPRCRSRVALLYLRGWPSCRKCARLVYQSQSEDAIGRSWRRSQKIAARLGQEASAWTAPRRPKGMRLATFERLRAQWWAEEDLRENMLAAFVARMGWPL